MTNESNPQRGTGVRKQATGVRPAVPSPAPAQRPATGRVPAQAPAAPAPAARTATAPRRPGGSAPGGAARPPLRSGSAPKQGSKGTKYLMLVIILLLAAMVAYVFIPIGGKAPLGIRMARMWGLLKKPAAGGETAEPSEPGAVTLDAKYKAALALRARAQAFLADQETKYKDNPGAISDVDVHRILGELDVLREQIYLSVDDLVKVIDANGKEVAVDAATAKEEHKKQKALAMELGNKVIKWKGPKDQIFSSGPEFTAQKFNTPATEPERKPVEKRDPKSLLTVVAPATPNDIPKPPNPAPADPKPADPKPEPEKPKEDPKPEPEKPKPEPEKPKPAEPKPEPEKPKEDPKPEPKPEPEKPKPAEPKPEPEKPKEDPKPEPKSEPEKPKPEEPKSEPKPEPKAEKKIDVVVAEADKLVQDGYPMAKDVIGAARNLPSDPGKLKTLSMKVETAQAFFIKARDTYTGIKESAPESADVAGKLAKIEKILALLQNASDAINSKK